MYTVVVILNCLSSSACKPAQCARLPAASAWQEPSRAPATWCTSGCYFNQMQQSAVLPCSFNADRGMPGSRGDHQPAGSSCAPASASLPCCDPWPAQKLSACCCKFQRLAPCSGASWIPGCLPPSWQLRPAGWAPRMHKVGGPRGLGLQENCTGTFTCHTAHAEAQLPLAAAASGAHQQPWD